MLGAPQSLDQISEEFAEHGIEITRVVIGGSQDFLSEDTLTELSSIMLRRPRRSANLCLSRSAWTPPAIEPKPATRAHRSPKRIHSSALFSVQARCGCPD